MPQTSDEHNIGLAGAGDVEDGARVACLQRATELIEPAAVPEHCAGGVFALSRRSLTAKDHQDFRGTERRIELDGSAPRELLK